MINLKKNLESIAADLIAIPSESGNEKQICDEIFSVLRNMNFNAIRIKNNLVVRLTNIKDAQNIALVGHLDTVKAVSKIQLAPKFENNNLIGRGAVDMKAGLACMLKIAYKIFKGNIKPSKNITIIFYSGEEAPLPNGLNLLYDRKLLENIDFALVLEPTKGKYCMGCLGSLTAQVEIKGKSSHSALPREGINAAYKSIPLIKKIAGSGNRKFSVKGYFGEEVMNITGISTDNPHNIIPDSCFLTINYRFAPGRTIGEAETYLRDIVKSDIRIIDASASCIASSAVDRFLLQRIERKLLPGWSDIAQLNGWDIPAVNYGPGSMMQAHTADEFISVKELNEFYSELRKHL